ATPGRKPASPPRPRRQHVRAGAAAPRRDRQAAAGLKAGRTVMWSPSSQRAAFVAVAFAAATLLHSGVARANDAEVKIDNFTFAPKTLTGKAGTSVTRRNECDIPHTVAPSTRCF